MVQSPRKPMQRKYLKMMLHNLTHLELHSFPWPFNLYIHTNHISPEARRDSDQHSLQIHFSRDSSASSPWDHLPFLPMTPGGPGGSGASQCSRQRCHAVMRPQACAWSGILRWRHHLRPIFAVLGVVEHHFLVLKLVLKRFKQREIQDIFKKTTTSNRFIDIQWITELESQYFVYSSREMSRVRSKKITSCVHELHAWYLLLPGGPSIHSRSFYSYLLQVGIDMYTYK